MNACECARHLVGVAVVEPQWLELLLIVGHGANREGCASGCESPSTNTNSTCRTPATWGKPWMATLYSIYFNKCAYLSYFDVFQYIYLLLLLFNICQYISIICSLLPWNASLFPRPLPWARPAAACCTMAGQWSLTSTREGRHDQPGRGQPERLPILIAFFLRNHPCWGTEPPYMITSRGCRIWTSRASITQILDR